ncbi:hypothetical protein [Candidatus Hydrogenosomobacter endosymbioticus]|uniref:Uncharacterized protein n=1 Tax=Candidatus Hydrogenosomobacter endosymbioticus TaxID=2558174 RepID=A0ABN6L3Y6_9PROT|nr:hypothetical protein [Candidatus Hydrogenosomobacter endosymbioticus]BDB96459.1 hypothetical protein HYD_5920 [Candidatus Hydrogenosomobacter endosymbioticus]
MKKTKAHALTAITMAFLFAEAADKASAEKHKQQSKLTQKFLIKKYKKAHKNCLLLRKNTKKSPIVKRKNNKSQTLRLGRKKQTKQDQPSEKSYSKKKTSIQSSAHVPMTSTPLTITQQSLNNANGEKESNTKILSKGFKIMNSLLAELSKKVEQDDYNESLVSEEYLKMATNFLTLEQIFRRVENDEIEQVHLGKDVKGGMYDEICELEEKALLELESIREAAKAKGTNLPDIADFSN